ncbi:uncharacterized protein LOC114931811 [Nylanderia fulva]|uniref:uncharacterized protein LOC114931811 n=1 Tax=Nylanderia fulva TaxID=613905 RepID=UPI0010FBBD3D|nr:uncharacterized protein LOC114931811 [Nylanderia fulva]
MCWLKSGRRRKRKNYTSAQMFLAERLVSSKKNDVSEKSEVRRERSEKKNNRNITVAEDLYNLGGGGKKSGRNIYIHQAPAEQPWEQRSFVVNSAAAHRLVSAGYFIL